MNIDNINNKGCIITLEIIKYTIVKWIANLPFRLHKIKKNIKQVTIIIIWKIE